MNDITKMRAEFEEKIRLAELENKYNERLAPHGIEIRIIGASCTQKGKLQASVRKAGDDWIKPLDEHDVQTALELLPMTEKSREYVGDHKYDMLSYSMDTHRSPNECRTVLTIGYIHEDLDLSMDLPINEKNPELMQYFRMTARELDETEVRLYIGQKTSGNWNTRKNFQFLTFNFGSVVRFQGGRHKQISEGILTCIASSLWLDSFEWENDAE